MKKLFISLQLLLGVIMTEGQIVQSSCTAPDSIIAKYIDDADRLAVRKFYRNNLSFKDSIRIPRADSDTVLNALIAVYNATTLPARDSVDGIHTHPDPPINIIEVYADSNLSWMQQLKTGNIPTGNASVDSLIETYGLSFYGYFDWSGVFIWHEVIFESDTNYNLPPLAALFDSLSGVHFSNPGNLFYGDGPDIWDSIYSDHVELNYSCGWGDCPSGCIWRHYWKFNVYFDCSVEYAGSYGDALPTNIENGLSKEAVATFPNPFSTQLTFSVSNNEPSTLILYDIFSRQILQQNFTNTATVNTAQWQAGIYFYELRSNRGEVKKGKVVKQ